MPSPDMGVPQPAPYYYEQPQQPYQEVTTTTTTTTPASPLAGNRKFLIIGLIAFGVILLIILLLSLTSRSNNTSTNNTTNTTKNVSLQFRGAFLPAEAMESLISDYETLNPNVKIEYADKWPTEVLKMHLKFIKVK